MSETQNKQILDYLKKGHTITPLEALYKFKCFRLSARIFNLKEQGHHIITKNITVRDKRFAEYTLIKESENVR